MTTQTQKIHAIADALAAENKRPTLAAIRDALGGGSFTTISEAMKTWAGRHAVSAEPDTTPEAISKAGVELAASLWRQAKSQAEAQLQKDRENLEEVKLELEQSASEAAALADSLTTENDTLKATIEQLRAEAAAQVQALADMTTRAVAAEAALGECRARADQLEKQLAKAEKRAEDATEAAARAREEAAQFRGAGKLPEAAQVVSKKQS